MDYTIYRYMRYTDRKGKWSKWHRFGQSFVCSGKYAYTSGYIYIEFTLYCGIKFVLSGPRFLYDNTMSGNIAGTGGSDTSIQLSTFIPADEELCKNCNKNWREI